MKKITLLLSLLVFSCLTFAASPEAEFARKYVEQNAQKIECKSCISSSYLKNYGLTVDDPLMIDGFSDWGKGYFSSIVEDSPPFVSIVYGQKGGKYNKWLKFKIIKDQGVYAIEPSRAPWVYDKYVWIRPWVEMAPLDYWDKPGDPAPAAADIDEYKEITENLNRKFSRYDFLKEVNKLREKLELDRANWREARKVNETQIKASREAIFARKFVIDRVEGVLCKTTCVSKKYLNIHGLSKVTAGAGRSGPFAVSVIFDRPPYVALLLRKGNDGYIEVYKVESENGRFVLVPNSNPFGVENDPWVEPWIYESSVPDLSNIDAALQKALSKINFTSWSGALSEGQKTNCGPVLEVKKTMVKVYFPVQNYGNEHWIPVDEILPPGYGCRFVNGRYVGS